MTDSSHAARRRIAVLGAGPVGLEAALAAYDAGMEPTVYELADRVGGNVRDWGHVRLFTPWEMNVSSRARRHLERAGVEAPAGQGRPTGKELAERLLDPVAALPWIAPGVRTGVRVRSVGREGLLKHDEIGTGGRAGRPFRLLLADPDGQEWVENADVVLDCTGTWHRPNSLGAGGIPAPGESSAADRILRRIPSPEEMEGLAGRRVLLVGAGHSAQTAARLLAGSAEAYGTRVAWAVRSEDPDFGAVADDPLPGRAQLAAEARRLASTEGGPVDSWPGTTVEGVSLREGGVAVALATPEGPRELVVDRIVSLTGSVGDHGLYRQLQVHECYATSGPMGLSAALLGAGGNGDCLVQPEMGAEVLRNPEPDFFILGSKSYGRNSTFLLRVGWEQVDQVFELLVAEAGVG